MSTNTEIEYSTTEVLPEVANTVTSTAPVEVTKQLKESPIEGYKKEYSIVGDGLYASVSANEAPTWLTGLIDSVVSTSVASGMTDYDTLVQDVQNAIDSIDVAKNTFVTQIDITPLVDGIVTSKLDTLNATTATTYATKVELSTAVATSEGAIAQDINNLSVSLNNTINSQINNVQTTLATQTAALASDISALETAYVDQESGLTAAASAVSGLQTYVGLDPAGAPNGTGLLATVTNISSQVDQKIEYYFQASTDIAPYNTTGFPSGSFAVADREARDGDVLYFTDTKESYYYKASTNTWNLIEDSDTIQALQDAAAAKGAADGKVSQYYAWGGTSAPATYVTGDGITIEADSFKYWYKVDGKLYYKPSSTWILVPTSSSTSGNTFVADGDLLTVFDPASRDTTNYAYNGTSWQQNGPAGVISSSKFFVDLENEVTGPTGHVAQSLSTLEVASNAYADGVGESVENKFAYNSDIKINDVTYSSGFGLTAFAGTGTPEDPYTSEFWINAEKFKFTNTNQTGTATPFSIDASGTSPEITFNGKVTFSNVTDTDNIATLDEVVASTYGAVPAYSNNDPSTITFDTAEKALRLKSLTDPSIGLAFPAFRVGTVEEEQIELSIKVKADAASTPGVGGLYLYIAEYDDDLPTNKSHVSALASTSDPSVVEATRNRTWLSGAVLSTDWRTFTYTYKPTATAKWASIVVYRWTSGGYQTLFIKDYQRGGGVTDITTALGPTGTTTIDGGRIVTGTIDANRIDTVNLVAQQAQSPGYVSTAKGWSLDSLGNIHVTSDTSELELRQSGEFVLRQGKSGFSDSSNGIWLGKDGDGLFKVNMGNSDDYLRWDGQDLRMNNLMSRVVGRQLPLSKTVYSTSGYTWQGTCHNPSSGRQVFVGTSASNFINGFALYMDSDMRTSAVITLSNAAGGAFSRGVAYSPTLNKFLAVGMGGCWYSSDGESWSVGTTDSADDVWWNIRWNDTHECFICWGYDKGAGGSTKYGIIGKSTDGINITKTSVVVPNNNHMLRGGGVSPTGEMVCVGEGIIMYSSDATNWSITSTETPHAYSATFDPRAGKFVIGYNDGTIKLSTDGSILTTAYTNSSHQYWASAYNELFNSMLVVDSLPSESSPCVYSENGSTYFSMGTGGVSGWCMEWNPVTQRYYLGGLDEISVTH